MVLCSYRLITLLLWLSHLTPLQLQGSASCSRQFRKTPSEFVTAFLKARSASPVEYQWVLAFWTSGKNVPQIAARTITYHLNSASLPHEQQGAELSKWRGSWAVSSGKSPLISRWCSIEDQHILLHFPDVIDEASSNQKWI